MLLEAPPPLVRLDQRLDGITVTYPGETVTTHRHAAAVGPALACLGTLLFLALVFVWQVPVWTLVAMTAFIAAVGAVVYRIWRRLLGLRDVSDRQLRLGDRALVVDEQTISYGEVRQVRTNAHKGLSLELRSGQVIWLTPKRLSHPAEVARMRWLKQVLKAAAQEHGRPQGYPADIPAQLRAVQVTPERGA